MVQTKYSLPPPKAVEVPSAGDRRQPSNPNDLGVFLFDGYAVTITLLHDGRTQAERENPPTAFQTPFHFLLYALRCVFALEGGNTWILAERDANQVLGMKWGRDRQAELANFVPRGSAELAKPMPPAPPPPPPPQAATDQPATLALSELPLELLAIVAGFLSWRDRSSLRAACIVLETALRDQARFDRVMLRVATVCTYSGLLDAISLLGHGATGADAGRLSHENRAEALLALANRLGSLREGQRVAAWWTLFKTALDIDGATPTRAAVYRTLAGLLRTKVDVGGQFASYWDAIGALPLELSAGARVEMLNAAAYSLSVAVGGLPADEPPAFALVRALPCDEQNAGMATVVGAVLHQAAGHAVPWQALFEATRQPGFGDCRFKSLVLAALAGRMPGQRIGSDADARALACQRLLAESATLPAAHAYVVMVALADALRAMPYNCPTAEAAAMEMFHRLWSEGFTPEQGIRLGVELLPRLPVPERATAWDALWECVQQDGNTHLGALVAAKVRYAHSPTAEDSTLSRAWSRVLDACRASTSFSPAQRAELWGALYRPSYSSHDPATGASSGNATDERPLLDAVGLSLATQDDQPGPIVTMAWARPPSTLVDVLGQLSPGPLARELAQCLRFNPRSDAWLRASLELAERAQALDLTSRIALIEAVAHQSSDWVATSRQLAVQGARDAALRILALAESSEVGRAPVVLAAMAQLANSLELVVGSNWYDPAYRPDDVAMPGIVDRIWRLARQLQGDELKAMLDDLIRRKTPRPGWGNWFADWWTPSLLSHAIEAVGALPVCKAEILAQLLAVEPHTRRHYSVPPDSFDSLRRRFWESVKTVPATHLARVLPAVAPWFDKPVLETDLEDWRRARAEFWALCARVPQADRDDLVRDGEPRR